MEFHVLKVHSFILGAPPLCFKQHLCKWRAHVLATVLHSSVCAVNSLTLTLSFSPNLHSGMPLRKVRIFRAPTTSDLTTVPLLLTSRLTLSTTSKKTSFFLYRMPSLRHETAFVTAMGGRACTCSHF